jgi:hypothetical protein
MRWISVYFKIFSASFLITFLSPGIAASIDMLVPCLLLRIVLSGLLLGIVLSVRSYWFLNLVICDYYYYYYYSLQVFW